MQSCFDENFHKVQERCGVNLQESCNACSAADVGYDCAKQMGGITLAFTLKCNTVRMEVLLFSFMLPYQDYIFVS